MAGEISIGTKEKQDEILTKMNSLGTLSKQNEILTKIDNTSASGGVATFSTPGTHQWTCPPGVRKVLLTMIGGGGSGGSGWEDSGTSGDSKYGTGGGGGAYVYKYPISTSPNQTYNLVVGAGGLPSEIPDLTAPGRDRLAYGKSGGASSAFGITCNGGGGGRVTNDINNASYAWYRSGGKGSPSFVTEGCSPAPYQFSEIANVAIFDTPFTKFRVRANDMQNGANGFGEGGLAVRHSIGVNTIGYGAGSEFCGIEDGAPRASRPGGNGIIIIEW